MNTPDKPNVATTEIFGHPTDFLTETRREADSIVIKVTAVMPRLEFRDGHFVSFAPPRFPWPAE